MKKYFYFLLLLTVTITNLCAMDADSITADPGTAVLFKDTTADPPTFGYATNLATSTREYPFEAKFAGGLGIAGAVAAARNGSISGCLVFLGLGGLGAYALSVDKFASNKVMVKGLENEQRRDQLLQEILAQYPGAIIRHKTITHAGVLDAVRD